MLGGSINGRPFKEDPTSYERTGIPCGNPRRYKSRAVLRMAPNYHIPYEDQRLDVPSEETETEGERHLKELLKQQLETKTSMDEQFKKHREFSKSSAYVPITQEIAGKTTLEDFKILEGKKSQLDELRQCGLGNDEIKLYLKANDEFPEFGQSGKVVIEPTALQNRLKDIDAKIDAKKQELEKPTQFRDMRVVSRHEMEIEKTLKPNSEHIRLLQKMMTTEQPKSDLHHPDDPLNHIKELESELFGHLKMKKKKKKRKKHDKFDFPKKLKYAVPVTSEGDSAAVDQPPRHYYRSSKANSVPSELDKLISTVEENNISSSSSNNNNNNNNNNKTLFKPKSELLPNPFAEEFKLCKDHFGISVTTKTVTNKITKVIYEGSESNSKIGDKPSVHKNYIKSVSQEEIEKNRWSLEKIKQDQRFRNYDPGTPSKTLYLKNLDKHVEEVDLIALFIQFQDPLKPKLVFKLLNGRMRGQAFITFPDPETAEEALSLTNGYVLKEKPIIIQFGKQ